jgi:hypothetical protein
MTPELAAGLVVARFAVQEARADHGSSRIALTAAGKLFFRISVESGWGIARREFVN